MDTTPDMTGKDVKPQVIHYEGGDVVLNREKGIVMEAAQFPELQKFVGQDLVCSDGTTLLGADDKAGIAMILQLSLIHIWMYRDSPAPGPRRPVDRSCRATK